MMGFTFDKKISIDGVAVIAAVVGAAIAWGSLKTQVQGNSDSIKANSEEIKSNSEDIAQTRKDMAEIAKNTAELTGYIRARDLK